MVPKADNQEVPLFYLWPFSWVVLGWAKQELHTTLRESSSC